VAEVLEQSVRTDRQIDDVVRAADAYYTGPIADAPNTTAFANDLEEASRLSESWIDGTIFKVRSTKGATTAYGKVNGEWIPFDPNMTPIGEAIASGSDEIANLIVRGRVTGAPDWGDINQILLRDLMEIDNSMFRAMAEENEWAIKFGEGAVHDRNTFIRHLENQINNLEGTPREAYVGPLYTRGIATTDQVAEARRLSSELPSGTTIEVVDDAGMPRYYRKTNKEWQSVQTTPEREAVQTISDVVSDRPSISRMVTGDYRKADVPTRKIYVANSEEAAQVSRNLAEIEAEGGQEISEIIISQTRRELRTTSSTLKQELRTIGLEREEIAQYVGTIRQPGLVRIVALYGDRVSATMFVNQLDEAIEIFKQTGDLDVLKEMMVDTARKVRLSVPSNQRATVQEIYKQLGLTVESTRLMDSRRLALTLGNESLGSDVVKAGLDEAQNLLLRGQEIRPAAPQYASDDLRNILHDIKLARRDTAQQARAMGIETSWMFGQEGTIRVPSYQLPDFIRTRYEVLETAVGQAQASKNFLNELRPILRTNTEAGDIAFNRLLKHDRAPLRNISDLAITTKQSIKSTALRGIDNGMLGVPDEMRPFVEDIFNDALGRGNDLTGSLPRTSKAMIDYSTESNLDALMRNPLPFWRFQSRSPVYWAGWFAQNPKFASAYFKHLKYSRVSQIEAGVVNRRGEPAYPAGYIRLPYTDTWINPLSPLSFRVIFPTRTPYGDEGSGNELATFLVEWSNVYGVSMGPWTLEAFYQLDLIDENMIPRRSIVPVIDLVPIYWQRAIENKFSQIERPIDGPRWGAENPWLDGQIENQMFKDALEEMRESPERANAILLELSRALGYTPRGRDEFGAPVWNQDEFNPVRTHPRWEEAQRTIEAIGLKARTAGYMAGSYFRTFSDEDAELRTLELETNFLRDAVNNEVGANYFALDPRPERRYEIWKAIKFGASPEELEELGLSEEQAAEGRLTSLSGSLRWVTAPEGERLFGVDRRDQIVQELHTRQVTSAYFDSIKAVDVRRDGALAQLPTGAGRDQTDPIWETWKKERDAINASPIFAIAEIPSFKIGIRPEIMLEEHYLDQEMWLLKSSRPKYDPLAAANDPDYYLKYQLEIRNWEEEVFPTLQATIFDAVAEQVDADIAQYDDKKLPGRQDLNPDQMAKVVSEQITLESFYEWKKSRDTVYDAADSVWEETYLDVWWKEVGSLSSYEREIAQREFDQKYPEGLTLDDYVSGIIERYGDKWTEEEIRTKLTPRESLTVEDRLGPEPESPEEAEDVTWNLLQRVPPGSIGRDDLKKAFAATGGDPDYLDVWYDSSGEAAYFARRKSSAKFQQFSSDLDRAIKFLDLPEPTTETLKEWQEVRQLNDQFKEDRAELLEEIYGPRWQALVDEYFSLPTRSAERRKFNQENPGLINEYFEYRCIFGRLEPLWGYYNLDTDDCKDGGGKGSGGGRASGRKSSASGGGRWGGRGRGISYQRAAEIQSGNFVPMGYRSTYDPRRLRDPKLLGTGGIGGSPYWPPGFGQLVGKAGSPILQEVVDRYTKSKPISTAGKQFLVSTISSPTIALDSQGRADYEAWMQSLISDTGTPPEPPRQPLIGGGKVSVS